jgi:hypothetical protein
LQAETSKLTFEKLLIIEFSFCKGFQAQLAARHFSTPHSLAADQPELSQTTSPVSAAALPAAGPTARRAARLAGLGPD